MIRKRSLNKTKIIFAIFAILFLLFFIIILFNRNTDSKEDNKNKYFELFENDKYGVINEYGEILIEPIYNNLVIPNPSKPVFICTYDYNSEDDYKIKILDDSNEQIFTEYEEVLEIKIEEVQSENPYEKAVLKYKKNGKYGLINFNGKQVTKPIYDEIKNISYKEGEFTAKKDGKYGLINEKGKTLINFKYDNIKCDGYYDNENKYNLAGYITTTKTSEGYKYGYINDKKDIILNNEYNEIYRILEIKNSNVYLIAYRNGQAGILKNDRNITAFTYQDIIYNDYNNVFLVEKNDKYGVLNIDGEELLNQTYDMIGFEGIYISATTDNNTEYYDCLGNKIENLEYASVFNTTNKDYYITINNDDYYGICDKDRNTILPNKYTYIEYAFDNYFICNLNNQYGVINSENEVLIEFRYSNIQKIENANMLLVRNKDNVEIYNSKVNKIISANNADIYTYSEYIKICSIDLLKYLNSEGKEIEKENPLNVNIKGGRWGASNKEGTITIENKYDRITDFNQYGFAGIKLDGKWGVIDKQGNVIVEPTYYLDYILNEPFFIGKYYKSYNEYGETFFTSEEN